MACSFHSRITAARARPCNGVETLLGNPLYFWLGLALCTKTRHHSRQTCFTKAVFAQDHPTCAGRTVQAGCGQVQATTAHPISITMRGFTRSGLPKQPWRVPLGCPWGFSRWQRQPGPRCSDPAPSQVCGLSWQKAIPLFCRMEGGMGTCHEGWGDREVQAVGDCRNLPWHQAGLPWKLSLGRRKEQSFTLTSNTDRVICCAQFLSTYKIPLQGHNIAVYEVPPRYPLCTGKTKSQLSGGFFFPTQEGSGFEMKLANLFVQFSVHIFLQPTKETLLQ